MTRQDLAMDACHGVNVGLSLNQTCRREMSGDLRGTNKCPASPCLLPFSAERDTSERFRSLQQAPATYLTPSAAPGLQTKLQRAKPFSRGTMATPPESHCQALLPPLGAMRHTSHFDQYRITCGRMRYVF